MERPNPPPKTLVEELAKEIKEILRPNEGPGFPGPIMPKHIYDDFVKHPPPPRSKSAPPKLPSQSPAGQGEGGKKEPYFWPAEYMPF